MVGGAGECWPGGRGWSAVRAGWASQCQQQKQPQILSLKPEAGARPPSVASLPPPSLHHSAPGVGERGGSYLLILYFDYLPCCHYCGPGLSA